VARASRPPSGPSQRDDVDVMFDVLLFVIFLGMAIAGVWAVASDRVF
jgi:hypothetical protein